MQNESGSTKTKENFATQKQTLADWGKTPEAWLPPFPYDAKHHLFLPRGAKYSATNFFQYARQLSYNQQQLKSDQFDMPIAESGSDLAGISRIKKAINWQVADVAGDTCIA